jgi:hypothetical protein
MNKVVCTIKLVVSCYLLEMKKSQQCGGQRKRLLLELPHWCNRVVGFADLVHLKICMITFIYLQKKDKGNPKTNDTENTKDCHGCMHNCMIPKSISIGDESGSAQVHEQEVSRVFASEPGWDRLSKACEHTQTKQ